MTTNVSAGSSESIAGRIEDSSLLEGNECLHELLAKLAYSSALASGRLSSRTDIAEEPARKCFMDCFVQ